MTYDLDPLEVHLLEQLAPLEAGRPVRGGAELEALWRAQVASRHCDFAARYLQKTGRSFYTIGSAGHESNACVALALAPDRSRAAPLPLGRVLPRARGAGRTRRRARHPARGHRRARRADRRRPAQGLRQRRAGGDPADLDDRLAPAARGRGRIRDRAREEARASNARGRPTRSSSAASATRRSTTRPRRRA